ncbi:MAG: threonine--tRNA ligase [Bacillota bacterium]|nr:threonine--tRNA ligase [Bacillota bacterium]
MESSVVISFPDGSSKKYPRGTTPLAIAEGIGPNLARDAVAARVNGEVVGLLEPLEQDSSLEILTFDSAEGREVYRHTASHIMAQAVKHLFPGTKFAIGPAIEDGFYYDFDPKTPFLPEDLEKIEAEMQRIIGEDVPLERRELSREEALQTFKDEPYKVELIEDLPEGEKITCYRQGDFLDLCAGPHLPATGRVRVPKVLHSAGAYWRGDEKRPMLQRIYGTAYEKKADLEKHLTRIEEAKRRDHRRLGKELGLFSIQEVLGGGLVLWHPKGALLRELVEDFWRKEHRKRGYDIVFSPHIGKLDLWKISGHWDWYKDSMYSPIKIDEIEYLLKPMNCPFAILMYKSEGKSYRDLPLRWGELGTVYRYERSGVLHGLLRVRGFTQDDAHIFCRPDQLEDEIVGVIDLAEHMIKSFGYTDYDFMLSVRDPDNKQKYIGDDAVWEQAVGALKAALGRRNLKYAVGKGEAKFYGPSIDIMIKDELGRGWQGPTIQVDFNLPERFDLTYTGEDGLPHRPVMIHRTVLGSMERFIGGLIEHYAGAFPAWLAPVQVKVLPITDKQHEYARKIVSALKEDGFRVELDDRNEKIGYKIREAEVQKIPYMLVVGSKEAESGLVAVRKRRKGDAGAMTVEKFATDLKVEVDKKTVDVH